MITHSGDITYQQAAKQIRAALKRRSGKVWSVTTSCGTGYGWLRIVAPKSRRPEMPFHMTEEDRKELIALLGYESQPHFISGQGLSVPPYDDYYQEVIDRAEGNEPIVLGVREFGD